MTCRFEIACRKSTVYSRFNNYLSFCSVIVIQTVGSYEKNLILFRNKTCRIKTKLSIHYNIHYYKYFFFIILDEMNYL